MYTILTVTELGSPVSEYSSRITKFYVLTDFVIPELKIGISQVSN